MPGPRLISIVGKKNAGKTTLAVALIKEIGRRGHRVMSIKHGTQSFQLDEEGKDVWRHMHEGGAERVVMESPNLRGVITRTKEEMGPRDLAAAYLGEAEFVVVEGYEGGDLPKLEVFRKAVHADPMYTPGRPGSELFLAILTDSRDFRANIPVLRFSDTAWMYRLVDIVLQGAK
ncbi:MAG TPA: molybdopterin-guanine dinucleotide biosynthesis protein B [Gemmatimonadales bacterium]|jgi:molybdopterin-guanine dinucleotide biosynthesis protein B